MQDAKCKRNALCPSSAAELLAGACLMLFFSEDGTFLAALVRCCNAPQVPVPPGPLKYACARLPSCVPFPATALCVGRSPTFHRACRC